MAYEVVSFAAAGAAARRDIERIFWETAATRNFGSPDEQRAYFVRWAGRYGERCPEDTFVASEGDRTLGYLAGCCDTASSAAAPIIADLFYYTPEMLGRIRAFPSHFHVNVALDAQKSGVGRALVSAFIGHCRAHGSPGMHVMTAADAPAARFYAACGFEARFAFTANGRRLCLYAMSL